ncbi:N-acetyltransferase [Pseudomonas savastanoi pv. phaseolicola]|uniref:GNAT family N-acetyltransferase n=1 Tax=Pseudomonas savastanoi TaxID=29438 RepID=UPI0003007A3F|nr:N-acetyltransferase [Pseudomonas savastanoi]MBN3469439.1 N-acetyltransferase [Pseudomonas savastanoi pv. phaseolicola]MBN3476469.1 N-acetyltransferase [Pseudomonas savastanoi pv. phaseolicola]RMO14786.1 Acetyltransferase, GNAT family [Pseudomonas savastanoi pv. phaseolicola]
MTATGIQVRRFVPNDEQGVSALILPIQREEFGIPITAEDQPDLKAIPTFYQTGTGDFWVAVQGNQVVGSRGVTEMFLGTTDKFHAAHRFYEKHGFREIEKKDLPASFPLIAVDSKFYTLALSHD